MKAEDKEDEKWGKILADLLELPIKKGLLMNS